LNEVSRCTLFVAAFPHHGVELKARIAHQSAFDERMLETGGALDEEQTTTTPWRIDDDAATVVVRHGLIWIGGNLDGVDRSGFTTW
jgi:hypothetical protein